MNRKQLSLGIQIYLHWILKASQPTITQSKGVDCATSWSLTLDQFIHYKRVILFIDSMPRFNFRTNTQDGRYPFEATALEWLLAINVQQIEFSVLLSEFLNTHSGQMLPLLYKMPNSYSKRLQIYFTNILRKNWKICRTAYPDE